MSKERTKRLAETVVILKESADLREMLRRYTEIKPYGEYVSKTLKDTMLKERERQLSRGKYDHEEVFIATGKYTNGRIYERK